MQTQLPDALLATADGKRADEILRSCVHCGFCNATCPTYQLLGDELDGPRGRIYLIKDLLESGTQDPRLNQHLDRCLTCRSCETTCPSGVQYGELVEIARNQAVDDRSLWRRALVAGIKWAVPHRQRFRYLARLGGWFRPLLPAWLAEQVPSVKPRQTHQPNEHARRVVLLQGCAQSVATPQVVDGLVDMLDARGIQAVLVDEEGCCGALPLHLGDDAMAGRMIDANVAGLAPMLASVEAIISTASGCGVTVKDYARLSSLQEGREVAAKCIDVAEFVAGLDQPLNKTHSATRVAWSSPCSLQHGQQVVGIVEQLLTQAGYELVPVADPHMCCGSAGTYSILQAEISGELRQRKLQNLQANAPELIATANVGCQSHLASAASIPVLHWLELVS